RRRSIVLVVDVPRSVRRTENRDIRCIVAVKIGVGTAAENLVDRAAEPDDVKFAGFIFAERRNVPRSIEKRYLLIRVPNAYVARAIIRIDIRSVGKRLPRPAINV